MGRATGAARVTLCHEAAQTGFSTSVSRPWGSQAELEVNVNLGLKESLFPLTSGLNFIFPSIMFCVFVLRLLAL